MLAVGASAAAPDNTEIADLNEEIAARNTDIERTIARIDQISQELRDADEQVKHSNNDLAQIDELLSERVALLYRLSRHGGGVRYLFMAETSTDFIKRVRILRRLILSELEAKRLAGMKLEESTAKQFQAKQGLKNAERMLNTLEKTKQDLTVELQRRSSIPIMPNKRATF